MKNLKKFFYYLSLFILVIYLIPLISGSDSEITRRVKNICLADIKLDLIGEYISERIMYNHPSVRVTITGYHCVPEQTDSTPDITASGMKSRPGKMVAVSRKLKKRLGLKWGDKIIVPGYKSPLLVADLMGKRITWDAVDIMLPKGVRAFKKKTIVTFIRVASRKNDNIYLVSSR
jgi:hypothetical protein